MTSEKFQQIEEITAEQESALLRHAQSGERHSLKIPYAALRYLIPTKLLELDEVKDPREVDIDIVDILPFKLDFHIENTRSQIQYITLGIEHGPMPEVAEVMDYLTDINIRRKGITFEFYQRLEKLLKACGFEYITGDNESSLMYFLDKLKRGQIINLPEEDQIRIWGCVTERPYSTYKKL